MSSTIGASLLALAIAPLAANADNTPNLYSVQGTNLRITYSTSGFDGKPHFTYQAPYQTLYFSGDQIRTQASEVGTLVTVTTVQTVDTGSTTFTLVVPTVNLGTNQSLRITTQGVATHHKLSFLPKMNLGQTETYAPLILTGTASSVNF